MANYPKDQDQVEFPTIEQVAKELLDVQTWTDLPEGFEEGGDEEPGIEVRLQVTEDGSWTINTGDPSFDTDHNGYWGSGFVTFNTNCQELAHELIEEAKDQAAFETSIDRDEES